MRKNRKRFAEKINKLLEIPKEISGVESKITILGFDEMLIENYKGISEYEEHYMKINTAMGIINITGIGMELEQITDEDAFVRGQIETIDIERLE